MSYNYTTHCRRDLVSSPLSVPFPFGLCPPRIDRSLLSPGPWWEGSLVDTEPRRPFRSTNCAFEPWSWPFPHRTPDTGSRHGIFPPASTCGTPDKVPPTTPSRHRNAIPIHPLSFGYVDICHTAYLGRPPTPSSVPHTTCTVQSSENSPSWRAPLRGRAAAFSTTSQVSWGGFARRHETPLPSASDLPPEPSWYRLFEPQRKG